MKKVRVWCKACQICFALLNLEEFEAEIETWAGRWSRDVVHELGASFVEKVYASHSDSLLSAGDWTSNGNSTAGAFALMAMTVGTNCGQ
jgi:hypothetical protein